MQNWLSNYKIYNELKGDKGWLIPKLVKKIEEWVVFEIEWTSKTVSDLRGDAKDLK